MVGKLHRDRLLTFTWWYVNLNGKNQKYLLSGTLSQAEMSQAEKYNRTTCQ